MLPSGFRDREKVISARSPGSTSTGFSVHLLRLAMRGEGKVMNLQKVGKLLETQGRKGAGKFI
jgi:hypothetical protein